MCAKLKCCLNYEVDDYVEASKKLPSKEVILQTQDSDYYLFKTDILAGICTYSTDKNLAVNLEEITARRAHEIIEMNKRGEKPLSLLEDGKEKAPKKPVDEIAHKQGKERGKTEMWYIMDSAPTAQLYSGLKMHLTPESYKEMVENDTICDALAQYSVKEGDVFFLPAGRIHAIGAGCFLAEIQQTSDVTYRIYDYKRKDKNGNYRQLHTKEAAECINYHVEDTYRTEYVPQKNQGVSVVQCPYFNTAVYDLDEPMTLDYTELDSFVILIGVKGNGTVTDNEGNTFSLNTGETVLIPATTKTLHVEGTVKFLETYV